MKDLYEIFRKNEVLDVDNVADYQVSLLDKEDPWQAAMAVTGLTLYQLEHGCDRGRFQMLLWALKENCAEVVRIRALVGLVLICGRLKVVDEWALEQMADVLSYNSEEAFDAWRAIMQSSKSEKHDPNFVMLKSVYARPPFINDEKIFFQPFEHGRVDQLEDDEWHLAESLFGTMHLCDCDKYAMLLSMQRYIPMLVKQLRAQGVEPDDLDVMNISIGQIEMIPDNMRDQFKRMTATTPIQNYVQQLYRFIRLSPHTPLRPTEDMNELRRTMIDKMIVVGANRIAELSAI